MTFEGDFLDDVRFGVSGDLEEEGKRLLEEQVDEFDDEI